MYDYVFQFKGNSYFLIFRFYEKYTLFVCFALKHVACCGEEREVCY